MSHKGDEKVFMGAESLITLRYYQKESADSFENYIKEKKTGNGVIVQPTAAGKSYTLAEMIRRFAAKKARILVVTHSKKLVQQDYNSTVKLWPEGKPLFGINSEGLKQRDTKSQVIFCGIQSVFKHAKRIGKTNLLIVDECFPAGTIVDGKPIEQIKIGDIVTAWDEKDGQFRKRKVTYLYKNKAPSEMVVLKAGGHLLNCTKNHPILTKNGWVNASDLVIGSEIAVISRSKNGRLQNGNRYKSKMLHMWQGILSKIWTVSRSKKKRYFQDILFERMRRKAQKKHIRGILVWIQQKICVKKDEREKSYAQERIQGKDAKNPKGHELEAESSGRERETDTGTTNVAIESLGMGNRSCGSYKKEKGQWISNLLQIGYWRKGINDRNRSGWFKPFFSKKTRTRQEKNGSIEWIRVDNIKIQESGSDGKSTEVCPDGYVYNIEVEESHTYVANGIVVHNCHRVNMETSVQYKTFIKELYELNPGMRVCGLSATPFRMGSGLIYGPSSELLFDDLVYKANTKELMAQGYLARPITPGINKENRIDKSGVKVQKGDYVDSDLDKRVNISPLIKKQMTETLDKCRGLDSIAVFAVSINHAENIAKELRSRGEKVAVIHSQIEGDDEKLIKQFEDRELRFLISVNMFVEGFDCPNIQAIVDIKPTLSAGRYVQMYGRGFRLCVEIGKTTFLVLDFAGNVGQHGPVDQVMPEEGDGEKDAEKAPRKQCEQCGMPCHARMKVCPYCGWLFPVYVSDSEENTNSYAGNYSVISEPQWFDVNTLHCAKSRKHSAIVAHYYCGTKKFTKEFVFDSEGTDWLEKHLGDDMPFDVTNFFNGGFRSKMKKPVKIFVDEAGASSKILEYKF